MVHKNTPIACLPLTEVSCEHSMFDIVTLLRPIASLFKKKKKSTYSSQGDLQEEDIFSVFYCILRKITSESSFTHINITSCFISQHD